jgi:hypothetical protein
LLCCILDAVKAFEKLWRQALFFKLKMKGFDSYIIIILRIYYDRLIGRSKLNGNFSVFFKQSRGVKQG